MVRKKTYLAEKFRRSAPTMHAVENNAIVKLEHSVLAIGAHHLQSYELEKPRRDASQRLGQDYRRELMYDLEAQRGISERCTFLMTSGQQHVFTTLIQVVQEKQKVIFPLMHQAAVGKHLYCLQ